MQAKILAATIVFVVAASACGGDDGTLTVYSGRSEELVGPLIERFEDETGISVSVRYGNSGELAATLLEEGENSPADVFFAQDPASIGSVADAGLLDDLPDGVLGRVPSRFSDGAGKWVGVSGRARVVVYDSTRVDPATLPADESGFTSPEWEGRIAVAPTNGSFLAFVAAKILLDGEAETLSWLEAMRDNRAPSYSGNSVIVGAVDDGEVDAGLVNHYYLFRRIAEEGGANVVAANHFLTGAGAASLVMPAGVGVLETSDQRDDAEDFVEFLLSASSQKYFADETFEYPLAAGVAASPGLPALDSLSTPRVDLSSLAAVLDLATDLVAEAGLL